MYSRKIVTFSSSLLLAVFAFACSPTTNINTPKPASSIANTSSSDDNTSTQDITTVDVGTDTAPTSVELKSGNTDNKVAKGVSFNQQDVKDSLIAYQDTEGVFKDTEEMNKDLAGAGFAVKAVNKQTSEDLSNDLKNVATGDLRDTVRSVILKDLKAQQAQEKKLKAELAKIQKRETVDKSILARVTHHKGYAIKRSPVITIDNGDGTITKVSQVEFRKGNILKVNKEARTFDKNKKLIKIIHNFIEKALNFTRESVRVVTFNDDGGRNVKTEATTKFKDGRVRVVNENKVLDKNGNGTSTAVITVTDKSGKETVYNVNSTITTGSTQSSVTDPSNASNNVSINTKSDGTAIVTTNTGTTTVNVENSAESQGATTPSASPTPSVSVSPSTVSTSTPSATPSIDTSASASPSMSASPSTSAVSSPTPSASPSV